MSVNIGSFMFTILKYLVELPKKLYEVINYQVNIGWVSNVLNFFGADLQLPSSISLITILGSLGAVTLVILIIYNIFKL